MVCVVLLTTYRRDNDNNLIWIKMDMNFTHIFSLLKTGSEGFKKLSRSTY